MKTFRRSIKTWLSHEVPVPVEAAFWVVFWGTVVAAVLGTVCLLVTYIHPAAPLVIFLILLAWATACGVVREKRCYRRANAGLRGYQYWKDIS